MKDKDIIHILNEVEGIYNSLEDTQHRLHTLHDEIVSLNNRYITDKAELKRARLYIAMVLADYEIMEQIKTIDCKVLDFEKLAKELKI